MDDESYSQQLLDTWNPIFNKNSAVNAQIQNLFKGPVPYRGYKVRLDLVAHLLFRTAKNANNKHARIRAYEDMVKSYDILTALKVGTSPSPQHGLS